MLPWLNPGIINDDAALSLNIAWSAFVVALFVAGGGGLLAAFIPSLVEELRGEVAELLYLRIVAVSWMVGGAYGVGYYADRQRRSCESDSVRSRMQAFLEESPAFDAEALERWSSTLPSRSAGRYLVLAGVALPFVWFIGITLGPAGYVAVGVSLVALTVVAVTVNSGITSVRPFSEQVAFSLVGVGIAVVGAPFAVWGLLTVGAFESPGGLLAAPLALLAVGFCSAYCLLVASDASRVRRGTHPPEAEADLESFEPPEDPRRLFDMVVTRMPDPPLRVRLVVTLLAVLVVNVAVLGVIVLSMSVLASVAGLTLPISGAALVGGVGIAALLLVVFEARLGYRRAIETVGIDSTVPGDNVERLVTRLAQVADVPPPDVAISETDEPNSFSIGNGSDTKVVVTTGLLETLDDAELEAVLAHEIAHVTNRDTAVATITAAMSSVSGSLRRREWYLAGWLRLWPLALSPALFVLLLPVLVVAPLYIVVSVVTRCVLALNSICIGIHAKTREYAADRGAARLVGDPSALAAALQTLSGDDRPTRDARLDASATLGVVPRRRQPEGGDDEAANHPVYRIFPEMFKDADTDTPTIRFLRALSQSLEWRPTTHPPTETRIERLRGMAIEES